MKQVTFTLTLECRDDVPVHVIRWIGDDLLAHAEQEYSGGGFDPDRVDPRYEGPPLSGAAVLGPEISVVEGA